ncbi:transporter substrate-binding domain-containing protein [Aestuariivirga sp.]|uniref:transporter substrate-binding domain-containing protein n=1 Tax=Aestuariivirga sp. TaxID=2650926 RepID=UPI0039E306A8
MVASASHAAEGYRLPQFRHVKADAQMPQVPMDQKLTLLADEDYAPFSFRGRNGQPAGLAVELALAACAEIGVTCDVALKPLPNLVPELAAGHGDVILSGPRIDAALLETTIMTRGWFRSSARLLVQTGSPLKKADPRALEGKRIGVIAGSVHEAWVKELLPKAETVTFDDWPKAQAALKSGGVDALFGDGLPLIYFIGGDAAKGCCRLLDGAYFDSPGLSRNAAFLMKPERTDLRDAFDVALDRLQENGVSEKLFNAYVPLSPW